jgi:hypothetical protein
MSNCNEQKREKYIHSQTSRLEKAEELQLNHSHDQFSPRILSTQRLPV